MRANQVFFLPPGGPELQLIFRTCRFSAVRCRPPFLSLPNLPPRVLLSRPPRWEKISTSQRPKRIVLQQYAGGGCNPPPPPPPYKQGCICFLLVWDINYTPLQLPAQCVVVADGKTKTHWRRWRVPAVDLCSSFEQIALALAGDGLCNCCVPRSCVVTTFRHFVLHDCLDFTNTDVPSSVEDTLSVS